MVRDETDDETLCAFDSVDATTTTRPRARGATQSSVRTTRCDDRDPSTRRANAHASHRARSIIDRRMDAVHPRPRLARSRRRSPDRVVARTRRRVSPARDARASGRLGARREGGARDERPRQSDPDGTARANAPRGRGSASATSRDANFFLCARRVTRPRRRAGTVARRERECEWCDVELMCSIAIVRRARRCASPPRARL